MFCRKCGKELNDEEFCPECGNDTSESSTNPEKKIDKKKVKVICSVALVLIVLISFVVIKGKNSKYSEMRSTPEKLAVAAHESLYSGDVEKLAECLPSFSLREIGKKLGLSESASKREIVDAMEMNFRKDDFFIELKIIGSKVIDAGEFEDFVSLREVSNRMTYEEYESITHYAVVEIENTIIFEDEYNQEFSLIENTDTEEVKCVKIDGEWYLFDEIE